MQKLPFAALANKQAHFHPIHSNVYVMTSKCNFIKFKLEQNDLEPDHLFYLRLSLNIIAQWYVIHTV